MTFYDVKIIFDHTLTHERRYSAMISMSVPGNEVLFIVYMKIRIFHMQFMKPELNYLIFASKSDCKIRLVIAEMKICKRQNL